MASGGTLAKLPLDVLQLIFRYACTDGGYTGCSLSCVSKAVRWTAQPARLHSVALVVTENRVTSFLALYHQQLESARASRPKISHLHLSLPNRVVNGSDESSPDEDGDDPREKNLRREYLRPLQTLFRLTADDLRTLVITSGFAAKWVRIFDRPFSRLHELTFVHHVDPLIFLSKDFDVTASPLFPALTHLHIVADRIVPLSTWSTHAPQVTHLRISLVPLFGWREHPRSAHALAAALGTPESAKSYRESGPPRAERTWPSLRHVVLQPEPAPTHDQVERSAYFRLLREMEWVVNWASKHGGLDVRLLIAIQRTDSDWRERVLAGWLEGQSAVEVVEYDEPEMEEEEYM